MYKCVHGSFDFFFMFEKLTKKVASKATDNAVEGVKQNLNDRITQYGDIIQIGLVLGIIMMGTHHFTKSGRHERRCLGESYLPSQQPIIVNNYYREREVQNDGQRYKRENYIRNGQVQTQKAYSKP